MIDTAKKQAGPKIRIKKVKDHSGGHSGGSWKVAYADFVTAMMALFLVLWLVSQGDQKLKAAIATYFRAPGVFDTTRGTVFEKNGEGMEQKIDTAMATRDDKQALLGAASLLKKRLSGQPGNDQIKIEMTQEGLHIQILDKADRVSFEMGSSVLTANTRAILADIAAMIRDLPNPIQIGGHTDSYTFPGAGYGNWELSADRANSARRELVANGIKPDRIQRIIGYADTRPLIPTDMYAPGNRRISIMLLWLKSDLKNPVPLDSQAPLPSVSKALERKVAPIVSDRIPPKP